MANADATNTSGFGGTYILKGIGVPRGTMTITTVNTRAIRFVPGHGTKLTYIDAGFTYTGQIQNLWIDHNFYNDEGKLVRHMQGDVQRGAHSVAAQSYRFARPYEAPRYGKHCATLFSQQPGYVKTWKTVCNNIGK